MLPIFTHHWTSAALRDNHNIILFNSTYISIHMLPRIATVEADNEPARGVTFPQPAFILSDLFYNHIQENTTVTFL